MAGLDLDSWNIALAHTEERPNLLIYDHYTGEQPYFRLSDRLWRRDYMRTRLARRDAALKFIDAFFEPGTQYSVVILPVAESLSASNLVSDVRRETNILGTFSFCDFVSPHAFLYKVELDAGKEFVKELVRDPDFYSHNSFARKA